MTAGFTGQTICIVGMGLMGGSLALAWRAGGLDARLIGVNRGTAALVAARDAGAIDLGTQDLAAGVADADVVVLATPVRTVLRQLPEVGRLCRPGTLVLDLAGSKQEVCAAMAELPAGLEPVGGHPMCGKERAGFAAADAGLYRDRPFVLCPLPRTSPASTDLAARLAQAAGARTLVADPASHDRAVAAISHLPYAVAVALTRAVMVHGDELAWRLAASGFRDTTRVAASDVDMMLDVLLTNQPAVLAWIDAFASELAELRAGLAQGDEAALRAQLTAAQQRRAEIVIR